MSLSESERLRRERRKYSYHLVASRNRLLEPEDEDDDMLFRYLLEPQNSILRPTEHEQQVKDAKTDLLRALARSRGDATTTDCQDALERLSRLFLTQDGAFNVCDRSPPVAAEEEEEKEKTSSPSRRRQSKQPVQLEGMWIDISQSEFDGSLGVNAATGDRLYSLDRMSFGKFKPANLICSLQGSFNPIHTLAAADELPAVLRRSPVLRPYLTPETVQRSYNIIAAFTIETPDKALIDGDTASEATTTKSNPVANAIVQEPVQGLMTTYGYMFPMPDHKHRLHIAFEGGTLEFVDTLQAKQWRNIFSDSPMEADGRLSYRLSQPQSAYFDLLYLDETLRIIRTCSHDRIVVFARVPYFPDE